MLFESTDRYFRTLGSRGRTVLFQLPLSVTVLLVTVLVALLHPGFGWSEPFLYSLAAHLILLAASAVVPWKRLPAWAVFLIPFLDCLAIGLSRESGGQHLTVFSFLLVFLSSGWPWACAAPVLSWPSWPPSSAWHFRR